MCIRDRSTQSTWDLNQKLSPQQQQQQQELKEQQQFQSEEDLTTENLSKEQILKGMNENVDKIKNYRQQLQEEQQNIFMTQQNKSKLFQQKTNDTLQNQKNNQPDTENQSSINKLNGTQENNYNEQNNDYINNNNVEDGQTGMMIVDKILKEYQSASPQIRNSNMEYYNQSEMQSLSHSAGKKQPEFMLDDIKNQINKMRIEDESKEEQIRSLKQNLDRSNKLLGETNNLYCSLKQESELSRKGREQSQNLIQELQEKLQKVETTFQSQNLEINNYQLILNNLKQDNQILAERITKKEQEVKNLINFYNSQDSNIQKEKYLEQLNVLQQLDLKEELVQKLNERIREQYELINQLRSALKNQNNVEKLPGNQFQPNFIGKVAEHQKYLEQVTQLSQSPTAKFLSEESLNIEKNSNGSNALTQSQTFKKDIYESKQKPESSSNSSGKDADKAVKKFFYPVQFSEHSQQQQQKQDSFQQNPLEQLKLSLQDQIKEYDNLKEQHEYKEQLYISVSYTHLTLPTICSVQISVVAVSLKKKKKKIKQQN
eukprot:TRINITY_DN4783_c0_g1_i3.p1 TRINITY_DN4783_c0_g1~~TRINITY_DN4783_c0_g1_i3.p1  ORF type:complete len:543 (+),score=153.84 TRINITY_DN4783_c0_g1_i3:137-1765(+)